MKERNNKKLGREWFQKGENDLKSAQIILKENDGPPATVCFLSQQVAEKYLKGFLVYNGKSFRKVHDLLEIISECEEIEKGVSDLRPAAAELNEYYIESRYPIEIPDFNEKQAKDALKKAEKIKDFVVKQVD